MSTTSDPFSAAQAMAAFNQMNASNPFGTQEQQLLPQGLSKEQANQQSAQAFSAAVQAANPHLDFSKRNLNSLTMDRDIYQQAEDYYRRYGTGMPQTPGGGVGVDPVTGQYRFDSPVSAPIAPQRIGDGPTEQQKNPNSADAQLAAFLSANSSPTGSMFANQSIPNFTQAPMQQAAPIPLNSSPTANTRQAFTAPQTAAPAQVPTLGSFGQMPNLSQMLGTPSQAPMTGSAFGQVGGAFPSTPGNYGGNTSGGMALEGRYGVASGNSTPFPIQGNVSVVKMAQGGDVRRFAKGGTANYSDAQLREAGEFIQRNLGNPELLASKAKEFGLTTGDILAAANTVAPVTAAQVTEYFRPTSYQPSAGWSEQQLVDAGNFIAQNINDPGAIEAARANVEQATGLNISSADILAAAAASQKPPELSRAMADVISGDVYGNMNVKGAYDWINQGIINQPQMSAQAAQQVMRDLGISSRDVAQAALLDPRISAGAQFALVSNPLYQQGQQTGLAALNANINNFIANALQYQTPAQARQSLENALQSGVLTAGRALNEYDVQRATGKSLNDLFSTAVKGPQVLGPLKPLPDLTGSYVPPTAPLPEGPPPALTPGQEGLAPGTAIVGNIPTSAQVRIPQLDMEFRNSAPRTAVYDRLGRVTGYEYTPAAKLTPATGSTVFSWTPPGVTSRPRQLLSMQDVPGATFDPVTGEARTPLSASQRFARDRAQLDRDFRQMYAAQAAQDSSIPAQAPASAAQAFRELAMSDPETAMQLKLRDIGQQRFDPARADMAVRARYGAEPAQAAISSLFAPFINRNMATLQGLAKLQNPVTYSQRRPDVAEAYAKMTPEQRKSFPTLFDYEIYHYNTFGKNEDPTLPNPMEQMGKLQSPYSTAFFSKGGEASTEDLVKKQSGDDVPRETSTSKQQLDKLAQVSQRKKA